MVTTSHDDLLAEMTRLRDQVIGVVDVVVASVDGMLITAETDEIAGAEGLAALAAATLGIARRAGSLTSRGLLYNTVARFSNGYLVIQAVGDAALIGVTGDAGLDVQRLHAEAHACAERIGALLTAGSAAGGPGS